MKNVFDKDISYITGINVLNIKKILIILSQLILITSVILWDMNVPSKLGLNFYNIQFLSLVLGFALFLLFINAEGGKIKKLFNIYLGIFSLFCCLYISIYYPHLVNKLVYKPKIGVLIGLFLVVLILEATRRAAGKSLTLVIIILSLYALLGHYLPGSFATRPVSIQRLAVYLGMDTNALFGIPIKVAIVVVVPFVLMGRILSAAGGGDFFSDLAMSLMGRYRGGAAKIAIFGSALFGLVSGSAVANVAGVGNVTIPLMTRSGFDSRLAASIEAVSSTGGQLMPPVMGAAAFLIAEFLQVPYTAVLTAAIIPALLYYVSLFIQVDLEAAKNDIGGAKLEELPKLKDVMKKGWHFPIPFIILIISLMFWGVQAEYAALLASAALLFFGVIIGYKGHRLNIKEAFNTLVSTSTSSIEIIVITAAAGLIIGVLNITGLSFSLALQLLAVTSGHLILLLLLTAVVSIILGMGMPTAGVYVILAILAAPALEKAGLTDMQANLYVMYFGMMSMITPPVALASYTAATISGSDTWRTGWSSVRVGWCSYIVPVLFALSPALLLNGSLFSIFATVFTAIFGVYMGCISIVGYYNSNLSITQRIFLGIISIGLLLPIHTFQFAIYINLLSAIIATIYIFRNIMNRRKNELVIP